MRHMRKCARAYEAQALTCSPGDNVYYTRGI